jgi:hypothetical protein
MNVITQIREQVDRLKYKAIPTDLKDAQGNVKQFLVKVGTPRFLKVYRRQLIALTHKQLDAEGVIRHKDGNKLGLRKRLDGQG